jgi:hypothetical protein
MRADPLTVSLETVIAAAPMLGHPLEDRALIRAAQRPELAAAFREVSRIPLRNPEQRGMFLVAPLDVLVVNCEAGRKQFHVTEINGTGIGGLTNLPLDIVGTVLDGFAKFAASLDAPDALVLVAVSGMESSKNPRQNKLFYEKMLYAEAVKRGLDSRGIGPTARVLTMAQVEQDGDAVRSEGPAVVLGYIKQLLNALGLRRDGRLHLHGRPVDAAINDRFCLNALSRLGHLVDMSRFHTMNRTFMAGSDKGVAYELINEYTSSGGWEESFPRRVEFTRVHNRPEMVAAVLRWLRMGRKVVIKAQGTGLGHGVEFFLDPEEDADAIIERIDHSIRVTEHYYAAAGGAFPYTLVEFVDTCTVPRRGHPLFGHKYEVRVVVYRDGDDLCAVPSISKICSQGYEADRSGRLSLINNITASAEAMKQAGTEFMLPLCNEETLGLLEITRADMEGLCVYCAGLIRHVLDQAQDHPERFGLSGVQGALSEEDAALAIVRA